MTNLYKDWTAKSYEKEIVALRAHIRKHIEIEDKQQEEIESLRKWQRDMVAKMAEDHDLAGYREMGEKLAAKDKEIETLKEQLWDLKAETDKEIETLRKELSAEKAKTDIDLVNDPAAWDRLDKAIKRGDEWERRATKMWEWATASSYKISPSKRELAVTDLLRRHPEAANWFEEE